MKDDINKEKIDVVDDEEEGFVISPNFGILIKHYRTKVKNYSLKQVEEISGVSAGYINRLEHGLRKSPSITKILQIFGSLDIPNDILVATMMKNNVEGSGKDTLSDVLIKNDFLINNGSLNNYAKDYLIRITEFIADAEWSPNSKVRELYELSELIDQLKEAL